MRKVFNLILKTTPIIKTFLSHKKNTPFTHQNPRISTKCIVLRENNVDSLLETTMSNQQNFEL